MEICAGSLANETGTFNLQSVDILWRLCPSSFFSFLCNHLLKKVNVVIQKPLPELLQGNKKGHERNYPAFKAEKEIAQECQPAQNPYSDNTDKSRE